MASRVEVEGASELRRAIRQARASDIARRLRAANKTIAQEIVDRALPHVPVRSGRLKASVKAASTITAAMGKAGSPVRVPYAPVIHWGWPARSIPRRPFLSDAAASVEDDVADRYLAELDKALEELRAN